MAIYITAICTAQLKMTNDKNKSNKMTGSYKYIYLFHYCELVIKNSNDSSKYFKYNRQSLLFS
jgi:hypothetical protein